MKPTYDLTMNLPLLLSVLNEHAAAVHGTTEIVSRDLAGRIHRLTCREMNARTKQLARALAGRRIGHGSRVATIAWNTHRHMELFYGVTGIGAAIHTVNPRLSPEQLAYVINDAQGEILFFDADMLAQVEAIAGQLRNIRHFVVLESKPDMPVSSVLDVESYEEWLAAEAPEFDWPQFDERTASTICYTSGTTGRPKGVVYSHRSSFLQTMTLSSVGWLPVPRRAPLVLMPLAPMFHSSAWNYPFGAFYMGVKLVLPGRDLSPPVVHDLIRTERVTNMALVPTLVTMLVDWVETTGATLEPLETVISAGSAISEALVRRLRERHGVDVGHSWGMTECMFGTTGVLRADHGDLPFDDQLRYRTADGRQTPGMVVRLVDADGRPLPHDGKTQGFMRVRGLWAASSYLAMPEGSATDADGWLDTGDIATIDPDGYIRIVDRDKDVIKSGGEWISSIEIERAAVSHPDVLQAAVIAVAHPKWLERPLLIVRKKDGSPLAGQDLLDYIAPRFAKWWLPDAVEFIDEFPMTGTNKIRKVELRDRYKDYQLRAKER